MPKTLKLQAYLGQRSIRSIGLHKHAVTTLMPVKRSLIRTLIKATPEVEDAIITALSKNSTTRGLSCQRLADLIAPKVSVRTVHRVLKRRGDRLCKPTTKPGLTVENKLTRLK